MASNGYLGSLPDNLLLLLKAEMAYEVAEGRSKLPLLVADSLAAIDMLVTAAENEDFPRFRGAIESLKDSRNSIVHVLTGGS